jgi:hypothetical protein
MRYPVGVLHASKLTLLADRVSHWTIVPDVSLNVSKHQCSMVLSSKHLHEWPGARFGPSSNKKQPLLLMMAKQTNAYRCFKQRQNPR